MLGIFVLALAYVMSHFYRAFLAVLSPQLTADLGVTPSELSDALGAWFIAFALSQFLVGPMLDRAGPRLTASSLFAIGGGGGALLFAFAETGTAVVLAMTLLGIGCSPVLMASFYIFKRMYAASRFAILASWFVAIGLAGNLLGASPLSWSAEVWGWRTVMTGLSLFTFSLAVILFFVVRDPPPVTESGGRRGGYLDILKMPALWLIIPLVTMNYAIAAGIRGLWSGPYLNQVNGLTGTEIGQVTTWMAIAMVAGSFIYGPLDALLNSRKKVILGGALVALAAILYWAINPSVSVGAATVLMVVIGMAGMSYGVVMAHATANIPDRLAGRGVTLMNFFNIGGVGVMQLITGQVYEKTGGAAAPADSFQSVFWVYAVCFGVALLIYLFSTDAKPKAD